ncbi:MAG: SprB repeat-containing protein, partial [Bacteroidota bacterium]
SATDYYNYLRGRWKDGTPLTFGGDGHLEGAPISYAYPSEPSDANGWSECTSGNVPGDRRFIMAFGPFDIDPGASQDFTYAAIWSRDMVTGGGCVDLGNFRSETDDVQEFFDTTSCKNFSPTVTATINNATFGPNGSVVLDVTGLTGPVTYSWSNGSTAKDLTNVPAGS